MAATQRLFHEEPLPRAVVLDTSLVVHVLHENEDFHRECLAFAQRLVDAGVLLVYSNLLRMEFWHGWARAMRIRGIPGELLQQPPLLPDPGSERVRAFLIGDRYLRDFLSLFRRYEIRIGTRLLDCALSLMAQYNLASHDACVIAMASHAGVPDVASPDAKFRRIDGIQLWNDAIPERRRLAP